MYKANYKRLLSNTGALYVRMLLAMVVALYASRVVLASLGVQDFGVYQVVAGVVTTLGFLQGALVTAAQRYYAYDLGTHSADRAGDSLSRTYSAIILIHLFLVAIVVLLSETAGYWFTITQLNIPENRLSAAIYAYHFAIAGFALAVISVPFSALLIAHERMGIYATIGIIDVLLKLFVALTFTFWGGDVLESYAFLLFAASLATFLVYVFAIVILFPQVKFGLHTGKNLIVEIFSFTLWNFFGNAAAVFYRQGVNILLNIFFGPSVNAARSLAMQAGGALNSLVQNVQLSANPQITKLHADRQDETMRLLIMGMSRYGFLLLLCLSVPLLVQADSLINIWLRHAPKYTSVFFQLAVIEILINSVSGPLMSAAQATGRIRVYQSVVGSILLMNLPISFICLRLGGDPTSVMLVGIVLSCAALFARLTIISALIGLSKVVFFKKVLVRCLASAAICLLTVVWLHMGLSTLNVSPLFLVAAYTLLTGMLCALLGLTSYERRSLTTYVVGKFVRVEALK